MASIEALEENIERAKVKTAIGGKEFIPNDQFKTLFTRQAVEHFVRIKNILIAYFSPPIPDRSRKHCKT